MTFCAKQGKFGTNLHFFCTFICFFKKIVYLCPAFLKKDADIFAQILWSNCYLVRDINERTYYPTECAHMRRLRHRIIAAVAGLTRDMAGLRFFCAPIIRQACNNKVILMSIHLVCQD